MIYETLGADPNSYYMFLQDLLGYFGYDFIDGSIPGAPEQCTWVGSKADGTAGPCHNAARLRYGPTWSLVRQGIDLYGGGQVTDKSDRGPVMGVPDALAQEVGAKVWVTGSSGADDVTVQSYGIIRPN